MVKRRKIDERDVDRLLATLTDLQISELFGMSQTEVAELRRSQRLLKHSDKDSPSD